MKRRRFISFVFVLILCFGMSGCGKEKKTTAPNKFQSDYMEVWGGTTVEEGDFRVINGLLYYIDFETMEGIPICNKPNCRHISWKEDRNTKCDAANIDISTVFPYEGKLYGFRSLSDGGSELVVSDLDGGDWKSKGMFITAEEIFQGGVVVGNQMFFLKDVVVRPEDHITEMRTDTVMCVLNFDTMELKELRREKGVFSIQFLGGTKDYQIYSVQEDNGIKCYQFDYDEEESKEISLKNRTQSVVKADETGFYYNSGIDYPKEVYKHDLETSENEICISEEEAKKLPEKDQKEIRKIRDLCDQFISAQMYVIAAPMWSLSFPAPLKEYIDCIVQEKKTISFEKGKKPKGLLDDKERAVVYIQSSGGNIPWILDPIMDKGENYVAQIMKAMGIKNVQELKVDATGTTEEERENAIRDAEEKIDSILDRINLE